LMAADCYLAALVKLPEQAQRPLSAVAVGPVRESQLGSGQRSPPEKKPAGNFLRKA
jgi:hypothetical protein